jgi:hypothetical protein
MALLLAIVAATGALPGVCEARAVIVTGVRIVDAREKASPPRQETAAKKRERVVLALLREDEEIPEEEVRKAVDAAFSVTKDPELVLAVGFHETRLMGSRTKKGKTYRGFTHIDVSLWGELLRERQLIRKDGDLRNPEVSFAATQLLLEELAEKYGGSRRKALMYFNAGHRGARGEVRQAAAYADSVLALARTLRKV